MKIRHAYLVTFSFSLFAFVFLLASGCKQNEEGKGDAKVGLKTFPSDQSDIFQHFKLVLGDGTNAGRPIGFKHDDYFYANDEWVVYKAPNAGKTHGTSNNIRTELAQSQKWYPISNAKLNATCQVMNVSSTGDARIPASYSVVIGQIHSADGHENEPLKIFYKKFPGHTKGSVFWNYEINTAGVDNSGRWDYSYPVWGYDFSVVGQGAAEYPPEPEDGIELGEELTYNIVVNEGVMTLNFMSSGHETKTFTKNLVASEYSSRSEVPQQVRDLFFPIGQDGLEREKAYAEEGLFFKIGCYNQTNGKDPVINKIWCTGAETNGGDLEEQYDAGNYAEVWFKDVKVVIPEDAFSNEHYFSSNDGLSEKTVYPHEVIPFMDKFKIMLGNGERIEDITKFENEDFFYTVIDGTMRWVVYKTPNSGVTSKNSSNTRTELHEKREWIPEEGGKLSGSCKVMHVSTSGDARVAASYSVVVGQIHSGEGHENEPCKIFFKKFPGHTKGSVFWNYEINTAGDDNSGRWDYSYPIWGYDMSVVGSEPSKFPEEPEDGIELGEEFSYEINVHEGVMYLTFESEGHETKTFTKNLIKSEYVSSNDIPEQTKKLFVPMGQDGLERKEAYSGELNYFKQGAYNQTNGKDPESNMVWCTGAETYGGDLAKQYANGSYAEVWFKEASVGPSSNPNQ